MSGKHIINGAKIIINKLFILLIISKKTPITSGWNIFPIELVENAINTM